jgi:peptidoglycan/LPS O-acetylase OafA/YrhL
VLGVVLFHFDKDIFYFGYLGVDIFFVISGLVITPLIEELILERNLRKSFTSFYEDRFRRLNPALSIVIVSYALIFVLIGPLSELRTLTSQIIATLIFAGNFQAYQVSQGNYFNPNPNAFLHAWSLSAEQQIYFALPLIFLFVFRIKKNLLLSGYVSLFVVSYSIFVLSSFKNILGFKNFLYVVPEFMYYLPVSRFWEFFLGSIIYKLINRNNVLKEKIYIYSASICLLLLFSILQKPAELTCIVVAFLMFKSKLSATSNSIFKPLIWLGNKSYPIYLTHLPIFYLFNNSPKLINFEPTLRFITSFVLILLSGWIISEYFEHNWRNNKKTSQGDFRKVFVWFFLIPLLSMLLLRTGTLNYFWLSNPPNIQGTLNCVNEGKYGECIYDTFSKEDKILLVGDSHAAAISQTFVAISRNLRLNPVIMSGRGCQVTPVDREISVKKIIYETPRDCQELNSNILSFLEFNPDTLVVVMQRNPISQEGIPSQEILERSIEGISQLAKSSKKVILLGFVPEFKQSQSQGTLWSLFSNNLSLSHDHLEKSSFATYKKIQDNLNSENVYFFNILNVFCTKSTCKYKHDGEYLYWDEHHLSTDGARYAEKFFEFAISSTIKTE